MSFSKRHPVYTQHKLSLQQLECLYSISIDRRRISFRPTLNKLEKCELVTKQNRWPGRTEAGDYWDYKITQPGIEALEDARHEGWEL